MTIAPLSFIEAIDWAKARGVVLPEIYYGDMQGLARAMSFSIAGVTNYDLLKQTMDSLAQATANGESFNTWKKRVADGEIPLELPSHRIENIFRTNLQGHYAHGRCEQIKRNLNSRRWIMYDAVNDSRTRPAHAAMDGFVAQFDDPIWKKWNPPNGYQCRCRIIPLSEKQAERFRAIDDNNMANDDFRNARHNAVTNGPDKGWDYSVYEEPTEGLKRAVAQRVEDAKVSQQLRSVLQNKWKQAEEMRQTTVMPRIHPDVLRSGDVAAIQAAEALVKAITTSEWPVNQINTKLPMTRKTLAALEQQRAIPEVDRYLAELVKNDWRTSSLQWHYFRYKYLYQDNIQEASELDDRFSAVLQDPNAQVYYPSMRYIVYSPQEDRWAILEQDGKRISVYRPRPEELKTLGEPLWPIQALID